MTRQRRRERAYWQCEKSIAECNCMRGDYVRPVSRRMSPEIWVSMAPSDCGRRAVVIVLDDTTRAGDIRAAIPEALAWRDRLAAVQGAKLPLWRYSKARVRDRLQRRHEAGEGPTALARSVNQELVAMLRDHEDGANDGTAPLALMSALLGPGEAMTQMQESLENLRAKKRPFGPYLKDERLARDLPISPERLRELLKDWRKAGKK